MNIAADDNVLHSLTPPAMSPSGSDAPMVRALSFAALNHLLIHELATASVCRNASHWFEQLPVATVLRHVMDGHLLRAGVLHETIRNHGGHPSVDPHDQDGSVMPPPSGIRVALALLLDLEQRGVAAYRQSLNQLDNLIRTRVEAELLPGQETALATIAGVQPPVPDGAV